MTPDTRTLLDDDPQTTERVITDLLEQVRQDARREALEEACRAICDGCRHGEPVSLHRNGRLEHKAGWCGAPAVRALLDKEPTAPSPPSPKRRLTNYFGVDMS